MWDNCIILKLSRFYIQQPSFPALLYVKHNRHSWIIVLYSSWWLSSYDTMDMGKNNFIKCLVCLHISCRGHVCVYFQTLLFSVHRRVPIRTDQEQLVICWSTKHWYNQRKVILILCFIDFVSTKVITDSLQ